MVNQNKVTNLEVAGRRRGFRRLSSRSRMCLRLVPAWLARDCLCSSQSPTGLLKSSGKGVLKNHAGRPPWNSSWGVKPVEELRCQFMVSTAQGTRRTQSLVRSCFIRILKFCSTTRFCLSQRGLDVWV